MRLLVAMLVLAWLWGWSLVVAGAMLSREPVRPNKFGDGPRVVAVVTARQPAPSPAPPLPAHHPAQPSLPREPETSPAVRLTAGEARLVVAVNKYRARYRLAPLTPHPILMQVARERVRVMTNACAHNPGGVWPQQAANRAGYRGRVNEDFAQPFYPEEAVWGWSQSYGHAMAMKGYLNHNDRWVNIHATDIGVGVYRDRCLAIFGAETR